MDGRKGRNNSTHVDIGLHPPPPALVEASLPHSPKSALGHIGVGPGFDESSWAGSHLPGQVPLVSSAQNPLEGGPAPGAGGGGGGPGGAGVEGQSGGDAGESAPDPPLLTPPVARPELAGGALSRQGLCGEGSLLRGQRPQPVGRVEAGCPADLCLQNFQDVS